MGSAKKRNNNQRPFEESYVFITAFHHVRSSMRTRRPRPQLSVTMQPEHATQAQKQQAPRGGFWNGGRGADGQRTVGREVREKRLGEVRDIQGNIREHARHLRGVEELVRAHGNHTRSQHGRKPPRNPRFRP